jgi:hypothetical protein
MDYKVTIKKDDGKRILEVTDRQDQNCKEIMRIAEASGKVLSDEQTGPDCDRVDEIVGG